jgi:hypothetical protein
MSPSGQPISHFTGVLADAYQFWTEINAVDENAQLINLFE